MPRKTLLAELADIACRSAIRQMEHEERERKAGRLVTMADLLLNPKYRNARIVFVPQFPKEEFMAGTAAPRRKRAKQKRLDGIEPDDRIKEIEDAADNYVDCRDERMGLTDKEVAAKEKLIEVMRKHKKAIYKGEGFTVTLNHKESTDVKVQTAPDPEEEEGGDE
jgi:hypothetical protein